MKIADMRIAVVERKVVVIQNLSGSLEGVAGCRWEVTPAMVHAAVFSRHHSRLLRGDGRTTKVKQELEVGDVIKVEAADNSLHFLP